MSTATVERLPFIEILALDYERWAAHCTEQLKRLEDALSREESREREGRFSAQLRQEIAATRRDLEEATAEAARLRGGSR